MIVLWNMGIMSGLRRYGEMGIRLAMGETKGQVYQSLILESVIIGTIGTIFDAHRFTLNILRARSGH